MNYFKMVNWKDIGERALKTFVEAFVATVAASDFLNAYDGRSLKQALCTTLVAGIAAGISAVWNVLGNIIEGGVRDEH